MERDLLSGLRVGVPQRLLRRLEARIVTTLARNLLLNQYEGRFSPVHAPFRFLACAEALQAQDAPALGGRGLRLGCGVQVEVPPCAAGEKGWDDDFALVVSDRHRGVPTCAEAATAARGPNNKRTPV